MKLYLSPLTLLLAAFSLLLWHDLSLLALLTAILIHELTHTTVLWICGGSVTSLAITPLGITIERVGLLSHRGEILLSLSAPLMNLLLAGVYCLLGLPPFAVSANLALGLLNLLPIYPLDGGKALSAVLFHFLTPDTAQRISRAVSMISLTVFWLISVAIAILTGENLSPLFFSVALFAASVDSNCSHK